MKLVSLFALLAFGTGCNVLKDEKDNKKSGTTQQCEVPAQNGSTAKKGVPDETDANDGGEQAKGGAGEDNDVADSGIADEEVLPFNQSTALALLMPARSGDENAMEPEDRPEPKPVDPSVPYPDDECRLENLPNSQTPIDPGHIEGNDPPGPKPEQCSGANGVPQAGLLDRAEPGSGAVEAQPDPKQNVAASCPSDATKTKNVPASGSSATLKIEWQVLDGLLVYEDARRQCAGKGEGWHLAESAELEKLFDLAEFQQPVETECTTVFWTAGARDRGKQCVAPYSGFRYTGNQNDPLPINNTINSQVVSGVDAVLTSHSVMCVKGGLKPAVSCGEAAKTFFQQRPLGVKDPKGALTWAKITVKSFSNSVDVETQCDLGKAAGWRMPTKAEVEQAAKSDLFKTAAYEGLDPTCPQVWHKPDDAVSNVTCGGFATDKDGAAVFATDAGCKGASVYGLCVQDIK